MPTHNELIKVRTEERPNALVVHVSGEVDLLTAPLLRSRLLKTIARDKHLVVDVQNVTFLDLTGARVLEEAHGLCRERERLMILVGSDPLVHMIIKAVRLAERLPVLPSLDEAEDFVNQR